ncbi:hypothetical protein LCGC14_1558530 [marine sediment metagenome]|uniref:Uncharacterized protein n=1 Tax=marine sediment metagenome TaxID=412755 RepID=A0A0F9L4K3_9ZZZZ
MGIKFYGSYSKNYSKLIVLNNQNEVVACLYINRINGSIESDSWVKN